MDNYCFKPLEIDELSKFEKRYFSQTECDGVTLKLLEVIGIKNRYYVEFGVQNGMECNTRVLKEKLEFNGLLMDKDFENLSINLHREFINAENINDLFKKYNVPSEFDVLSIDIDRNDIHVWNGINNDLYKPNIVIIEYSSYFFPPMSVARKYYPDSVWHETPLMGASLSALNKVGKSKGYTLIYSDMAQLNLFFVRDVFISKLKETFPLSPFGNEDLIFKPSCGVHFFDKVDKNSYLDPRLDFKGHEFIEY